MISFQDKPKKFSKDSPIAIIGMSCLFPKSSGLKEYWRLLFHGEDAITPIPDTHWSTDDYFDADPKKPDHVYCKRGGFLSPVLFDPSEFGIPPTSMEATDTSQLLSLVAAKRALEDSGYGNGRGFDKERTSVILGVTGTQELVIPLSTRLGHPVWRKALKNAGIPTDKADQIIQTISDSYVSWQENSFPGLLGNVVAGRISNRLDLGGTNCVVDAACASSMSAIHLAVMELVTGRSDMVLTGGTDTLNDIFMHMCFSKTHVLSPTGDARPFSKHADGTVLGEGIGILVLKRLEDAEKDGDRIYAVIQGLGSSSDGKSQSIYAPRMEGQVKALQNAYRNSDIDPATVELIEAHGTGTKVGDRVEFQALRRVFGKTKHNEKGCALGSVKSMIGHTKAAAGVAGLIKAALSLYNKVLPPTLKVGEPDPNLNFHQSPFYLNTASRPWLSSKDHPRRAGISAFGFGGSNFHAVLEEYRSAKPEVSWDGSVEIFALSALEKPLLLKQLRELKSELDKGPTDPELNAAAFNSRTEFSHDAPYRLLLIYSRAQETIQGFSDRCHRAFELLSTNDPATVFPGATNVPDIFYGCPSQTPLTEKRKIAFVFPGQGSQYVGMGRQLVCSFPEALGIIEKANQKYSEEKYLSDYIYPQSAGNDIEKEEQENELRQTQIAQPAIGAINLAMFQVLKRFGIEPDATCGHSFGELTALCAAGWFDVGTLFDLAVTRGRLMADAARKSGNGGGGHRGTMMAVSAPLEALQKLIDDIPSVVLANRNAPKQGVLSGTLDAMDMAEKACRDSGFMTRRLPVAGAFHSAFVKGAEKPFARFLQKCEFAPSATPVYSNTSAKPYPVDAGAAKRLLAQQLIHPVDFVGEIENLYRSGVNTFIEIGPKSVLTGLIRSILPLTDIRAVSMDASTGKGSAMADLARVLCHLSAAGFPVALNQWEEQITDSIEPRMRIPVLGANRKPQKDSSKAPVMYTHDHQQQAQTHFNPNDKTETPMSVKDQSRSNDNRMHSGFMNDTLRVVQEGLKSMQTLQMQTAEAHKKFLETQSEASRILQEMMESTRRLTEAVFGIEGVAKTKASPPMQLKSQTLETPNENSINTDINERIAILQKEAIAPVSIQDTSAQTATGPEKYPQQDKKGHTSQTANQSNPPTFAGKQEGRAGQYSCIEDTLLAVVSELTGYPLEMLGLDMDIEADLGIDSIKRVEILSTLEERMPGLPPVSPDLMGRMKTLAQIIAHFNAEPRMDPPVRMDPPGVEIIEERTAPDTDALLRDATAEINDTLLAVVSELTGYPLEMLGLDMDIEADLGIDSIKRVEILSTLEERMPGLPPVSPDLMGRMKTLAQIIAHFSCGPDSNGEKDNERTEPPCAVSSVPDTENTSREPLFSEGFHSVDRKVVSVREVSAPDCKKMTLPSGRRVYVTGDTAGLSDAIVEAFRGHDIDAAVIPLDTMKKGRNLPDAAGLIIVANPDSDMQPSDLAHAFFLTQHLAADLITSAKNGGAFFATITRLDGAFGFGSGRIQHPIQGGLCGLAKTARIEWDGIHCRAIDICPEWRKNNDVAKSVVAELLNAGALDDIEIGFAVGVRRSFELTQAPFSKNRNLSIALGPKDVVLVTGGARGVTAAAAHALASAVKPILILIGRSPSPTAEPVWLQSEIDAAAIKRAIIRHDFNGLTPLPAEVEKTFRKRMANREIAANLAKIESTGASVHYCSADIRDAEIMKTLINEIRSVHGPVKGFIHGAGVLEDRLITDKTPEQFQEVFDTKVIGMLNVLQAVQRDPLKYMVLFSSVAARLGNRGQADYAMANEVLNKAAVMESALRPNCKVVSINWGPWDGGMVSGALKREFARNNIGLISMETGAECMLYEMSKDMDSPVEVVIGSDLTRSRTTGQRIGTEPVSETNRPANRAHSYTLTLKREIDVETLPILGSHVLDGKPVVPFALMAEWFGHGALHENPGLSLFGIDDMRLLKGIRLDQKKRLVRLFAGKARRNESLYEVEVELRDGIKNGIDVIHSRAKAILTDSLSSPPVYTLPQSLSEKNYFKTAADVYDKILFHGYDLHGIKEIINCSPQGMTALISTAPPPTEWMKEPFRSRWIGDPLALDCAFQMATLWCFEEKGAASLPSYCASYRQYRKNFPTENITAVLEVADVSGRKMNGNFTFLDSTGVVIAQLKGCEAVMDTSLFASFKAKREPEQPAFQAGARR